MPSTLLRRRDRYPDEPSANASRAERLHEEEVRSYKEVVTELTQKVRTLEAKNEARLYEEEIIVLTQEVQLLEGGKNGAQEEITTLTEKVRKLEEDATEGTPARIIGREVRLRFLENYRKSKRIQIGENGRDCIKFGNRAAHRGRPVVDALLCLEGAIQDRNVYPDLYGVSPEMMNNWKDVPEMVEVTGFRGSLQVVGRLTAEFRVPFQRLVELATEFKSSPELKGAFAEKQVLQQLHLQVQDCYDRIVEANPWIKTPRDNGNCGSRRLDV